MANIAFGYPYKLQKQENGWWLVRFPQVPEALTEGETKEEAFENAKDALIAALEGYVKEGRPIPRPPFKGERLTLPSLVTAKLAVYENMRRCGWTRARLANALQVPENSVRRLLNLRHSSHMWAIDEALAKMDAELPISLPDEPKRKAG